MPMFAFAFFLIMCQTNVGMLCSADAWSEDGGETLSGIDALVNPQGIV